MLVDDLVVTQAVTVYGNRRGGVDAPEVALMERVLRGLRCLEGAPSVR